MPANSPTISFIVLLNETTTALSECLNSLLMEDISKEIILVDNGVSTEISNIAITYSNNYANMLLVRQKELDWCKGINRALDLALGEFISIIGSNDRINNGNYTELLNRASQHQATLVYGGVEEQYGEHTYRLKSIMGVEGNYGILTSSSQFWRKVLQTDKPFELEGLIIRREYIQKHHLRLLHQHLADLHFVEQLFNVNPNIKIAEFEWGIYHKNRPLVAENSVLFFSHEMSRTGAPLMLYYAALAVKQAGGNCTIIAPPNKAIKRELIEHYLQVGIEIKITENLNYAFIQSFRHFVFNTIISVEAVRAFQRHCKTLPLIWWIHEGSLFASRWSDMFDLIPQNLRVLAVSEYANSFIPAKFQASILHNGIPEIKQTSLCAKSTPALTFTLLGTINEHKRIDLFCEAIVLLPEQIRQHCRFLIVGDVPSYATEIWEKTWQKVAHFPEVEYWGAKPREQIPTVFAETDVLVSCSRDESFSLVVLEAAQYGKPAILHKNIGLYETLIKENAGLSFECGNATSLAQTMQYAYEHSQELNQLGQQARAVYEKYFTFEKFAKRFLAMLNA